MGNINRLYTLCHTGTLPDVCRRFVWSQISKIVYGASDENHVVCKKMGTQLHPKTTVVSGIFANEAFELMKRF
jgi:pyrimidine deaminase RibD-like protein